MKQTSLQRRTRSRHQAPSSVRFPVLAVSLAAFLLAACSEEGAVAERPPACGDGPSLLKNGKFAEAGEGEITAWQASQHAGAPSFATGVENGVFTVERTGPEPWFTLTQFPAVEPLLGHRLELRMDLELALDAEGQIGDLEPGGGAYYRIWGRPFPTLTVTRQLQHSSYDHEPHLGEHDWFTVTQVIDVPETATRMEVGMELRANGVMRVRNPELFDCGPIPEAPDA